MWIEVKICILIRKKITQVIKSDNSGLKALDLSNKRVDAYKDVSLIKNVFVFYAEDSSTKHQCLMSLA